MDLLATSFILVLALTVLTGLVAAAEGAAFELGRVGNLSSWWVSDHSRNSLFAIVSRQWLVLSGFVELRSVRAQLGLLICMLASLLSFAVIPVAPVGNATEVALMIAADCDVALLYVLAMFSLTLFGEVLSHCRTLDVGEIAERFVAIAAFGVSAAGIVRMTESWQIAHIINAQESWRIWLVARQPLGCVAMLLLLIWQMGRITTSDQMGTNESNRSSEGPGRDLLQMGCRLQLIAMSYVFVDLFFGGWHVWGADTFGSSAGWNWFGWGGQFLALHLKVVTVLLWLIWLRFIRLHGISFDAWSRRLTVGALIAAAVNFIVIEFSERYLAAESDVWKAAASWIVLMFVLILTVTFARHVMPE